MLSVQDLKASYDDSPVLFGVSLSVKPGEVVTLLGRNGMGKSTTISSIMGLHELKSGSVIFEGQPIGDMPAFKIARMGLGLVPEGRQVFPNLTVHENLMVARRNARSVSGPWTTEKIYSLFPSLSARSTSFGSLLSGGEQQMLAIGRALMTNPTLLILDEATEGLAPLIRSEIWHVLLKLKDSGQSILIVDKNIDALMKIAERHYILEKGRTVWSGTSDALQKDERLQRRYLGV